jgi:hypothetical protein
MILVHIQAKAEHAYYCHLSGEKGGFLNLSALNAFMLAFENEAATDGIGVLSPSLILVNDLVVRGNRRRRNAEASKSRAGARSCLPILNFFGSAYHPVTQAQRVVIVNARRQTVTSDLEFSCSRSAPDCDVTLISQTIAVQDHLAEILLRSMRRRVLARFVPKAIRRNNKTALELFLAGVRGWDRCKMALMANATPTTPDLTNYASFSRSTRARSFQ